MTPKTKQKQKPKQKPKPKPKQKPKPPVLAYDPRVAAALSRLARLGVVRLAPTPDGQAVTITRQGRVALTRSNPAPGFRTSDVRALQSLAARECAAKRRVAIETREDVADARRDRRAKVAAAKRDARERVASARAKRERDTRSAAKGTKTATRKRGAKDVAATRARARADVAATIADGRAAVERARASRTLKRDAQASSCEAARERSRHARGVRAPRATAAERAADRAHFSRADVEAIWGDVPGAMEVYRRTGGPVRWSGPRGWERFGEYMEAGGLDEASAYATDDAEDWAAREWAAQMDRERLEYERDPAAYHAARANPHETKKRPPRKTALKR